MEVIQLCPFFKNGEIWSDIKEELEDQMAEIQERQEFFANAAEEDKEDLMGELDELEALAMEEEMENVVNNS